MPGATFFFFGTLMDGDVLAAVLGRALPDARREAATVRGFRRVLVAGRDYPMLLPSAGGRVTGMLASGLDRGDIKRLRHYEGRRYTIAAVTARTASGRTVKAALFACSPTLATGTPWRLDLWRRRHKPNALRRIAALMAGIT